MKKILVLATLLFALGACNNSEEKKETNGPIDLGQLEVSETNQTELQQSKERGGLVYTDFCMQCHLANGKGVPGNFPPLSLSNWLKDRRTESIQAVKYGQNGEIEVNGVVYDGVMVPMGLSNQEVADMMNYVMNSWGNTQDKMVTEAEVNAVEK
jgi:mono/diheme cytochrome c family protein